MAKSVLNVASLVGGLGFPFINWVKGGINYGGNAANMNNNGCPIAAPSSSEISFNSWRMTVNVPTSSVYSGHWVLKWRGTGAWTINTQDATLTVISGGGFVISNSGAIMTVAGTNVRVEFTTSTTAGSWFGQFVASQTYDSMEGPRLVRLADETAEANGEIYNPDFIAQLKSLNIGVIRMVQWSNVSSISNVISKPYTYDPGIGYLTWASQYQPNIPFVGNINNTSDAFTCLEAGDTPVTITDGEMVYGNIVTPNTTTTPTLNINHRGAKTILNQAGIAVGIGAVVVGPAVFTYNAMIGGYLYNAANQTALDPSVPLAAKVALCNEIGCDLWLCLPALITDNEITLTTTYIRDTLNPGLKCYFEYGNEIWGGVPHPADQVQTMANVNSTGRAQMLGYMIRRCMGLITSAWSPRKMNDLRRVAAWQEFGDQNGFNVDCLQGQNFALMTSLGWDTAPNRPVDFTDVVSYATYYEGPSTPAFQGGYTGNTSGVQAALYSAADDYASGDPVRMSNALNFVDSDIRSGTGGNGDTSTLAGNAGQYTAWETMVATYDASRIPIQVVCYEGGLQIAPPTTATLTGLGVSTSYSSKITNLFNAYKNDARCEKLIIDQFNQFMSKSHSVAPAWYDFAGDESQWSTHPGDLYSIPFQSYNAIKQFNQRGVSNLRGLF